MKKCIALLLIVSLQAVCSSSTPNRRTPGHSRNNSSASLIIINQPGAATPSTAKHTIDFPHDLCPNSCPSMTSKEIIGCLALTSLLMADKCMLLGLCL